MAAMLCDLSGYIYVLFFGEYVSIRIACGAMTPKSRRVFYGLCSLLLLMQGLLLYMTDIETVRLCYPLITHLPTVAALSVLLHAKWDVSVVAVAISYSMCQLLRWIGLFSVMWIPFPVISAAVHLLLGWLILLLLKPYCLPALHGILCESPRLRLIFGGGMPVLYYAYDYFLLYTQLRYVHLPVLQEFLPTAMVMFYILFACVYQQEARQHQQAKEQAAMLEAELTQAEHEIGALRMVQEQTAIYRHDLRHHLRMIGSLLQAGKPAQAQDYINSAESEIEAIVPARYCEHDIVNLLLGAYVAKAKQSGIQIRIKSSVPQSLNIPHTELCVLLSNGMENALQATMLTPEGTNKIITFFCGIRQNNLLIEIQNPYCGEIVIEEGLPCAKEQGHGFGCRSIAYIAKRRNGICSFDAAHGVFSLRVAIPLMENG